MNPSQTKAIKVGDLVSFSGIYSTSQNPYLGDVIKIEEIDRKEVCKYKGISIIDDFLYSNLIEGQIKLATQEQIASAIIKKMNNGFQEMTNDFITS